MTLPKSWEIMIDYDAPPAAGKTSPTCRGAVGVFCPPGVSTWSGVNGEGLSKKGVNTKQNPMKSKSTKLCLWVGSGILDRWIMLIRPFFVWSSTFRGVTVLQRTSPCLCMSFTFHYHTLIKHSFLISKQGSKHQSNVGENSIATPTLPVRCFQQPVSTTFPPL